MNKKLKQWCIIFCLLFVCLSVSGDIVLATEDSSNNRVEADKQGTSIKSKANIGFSTKIETDSPDKNVVPTGVIPGGEDGNSMKSLAPTGKLPKTGEFLKSGISSLGILFLITLAMYYIKKIKKIEEN